MSVPAGDTVFVKLGTRAVVAEHATELVGLASLCQRFASLDDHAAQVALSKRIARDEVPVVRKLLGEAVRAGLLVSQTALVESLTRRAPAERCQITTVAVPTRDRVASLARCLPTYVEDALAHGRAIRWLVADDSADPDVGASCRAVLGDLQARYRIESAYAGVAEKRAFAGALAREGLDPEVLEFALFDPERIGYTPGANQNAILLETIGEGFLAVDDDTFCPLRRSPDAVAGLEIAAVAPTCWPLSAASNADDSLRDADAVGKHEALLGRDLGACVRDVGAQAVRVGALSPRDLTRLETVPGRVVATWMGAYGDPVYEYPGLLVLSAQGEARRQMLATARGFSALLRRCQLQQSVGSPTIADGSFWTSTAAAYDHRQLLPPFMPVLRGQDFVFAATAHAALPQAWFGLLPYAVGHRRPSPPGPALDAVMVRASAYLFVVPLVGALQAHGAPGADDAAALRRIGRGLASVASESPAAFAERLRQLRYAQCIEEIRGMEALLLRHRRMPRPWARELDRCVRWQWQALRSGACMVPRDLEPTEAEPLARVQRLVLRFGQLLAAWPDIIEATRRLWARGQRLAVPLQ